MNQGQIPKGMHILSKREFKERFQQRSHPKQQVVESWESLFSTKQKDSPPPVRFIRW